MPEEEQPPVETVTSTRFLRITPGVSSNQIVTHTSRLDYWQQRLGSMSPYEWLRQTRGEPYIPPAEAEVEIGEDPQRVPPLVTRTSRLLRARTKKSWEIDYLEEEPEEPDIVGEIEPQEYEQEPVLPRPIVKSLKDIADVITPGILGMQYDTRNRPYSLVFRAKADDDPRKKLLKGYGWYGVKKAEYVLWAAATLENYNTLLETGLEYKVTPKVMDWYKYITSLDPLGFVQYAADCPLFDYQRDAVDFLTRRQRAMLALSPGLGKTLTSAYAASSLPYVRYVLLVCPASLLHYWHSELRKWQPALLKKIEAEIWHRETGTQPTSVVDLDLGSQFWAITNAETLTRFTDEFLYDGPREIHWDLMIVDESIMYKHRESKRAKAVNRMARSVDEAWLLTGAPATRYLDDMWHQFHILNNRGYGSYWRFADRYCRVERNVWANTVVANRRNAEEEIKENFKDIYFARSQDQVADIPDWLFEDLDIEMKPRQEEVYEKLQKDLEIELEGMDDSETLAVDNRLTLMLRSLQVASNPLLVGAANSSGKWSALPELTDIYPGPFLVWVNFIRTGEVLKEQLKEKFGEGEVCLVNGSTSMVDRQLAVDTFQGGAGQVLVMNQAVGKFGFTLTRARTSIFVERTYDDSYFQCLHRNRRIGTTQSPVVLNLRSVTRSGGRTIDHVIHDALDYRTGMIKKITVGDLRKVIYE